MNDHYPPMAFSFELSLTGSTRVEASFQEITGLTTERDVTELQEGGENRFVHKLPGRAKVSNILCKRGLIGDRNGALAKWLSETLEGDLSTRIQPKDLILSLVGERGDVLIQWTLSAAWPVKWSVSAFDAQTNALTVETLEFAHGGVERKTAVLPPAVQSD